MIKTKRLQIGLSQVQLAQLTGLSQGYISRMENDNYCNITIKEIIKVATVLGIDENEVARYFIEKYKIQK